jgi:hypothetical protein
LMYRKYRYMEVNLQQKRKGLEVKIPDISKTLDVVRFLESRRVSTDGCTPDFASDTDPKTSTV